MLKILLRFLIICIGILGVYGNVVKRSENNLSNITENDLSELKSLNIRNSLKTGNGNNRNDESSPTDSDGAMGSASDYILIGMIVAMMLCMAVCCVCLFCRSSSHFSICGFNFEVNDRTQSVAIDDVSELHEVVPLTPTTVGSYNIPDIERKLRSDPPPPTYSDVAGPTMLDRLKWKSKKKVSGSEDKLNTESRIFNKSGETFTSGKNKRSEKRNRSSRMSFQRSISYQSSRGYKPNSSNTMPKFGSAEDECRPQKRSGLFSLRRSHSALQHSASDCTFHSRPARILEETMVPDCSTNDEKESSKELLTITVPSNDNNTISESLIPCKESNTEQYDDEVFM